MGVLLEPSWGVLGAGWAILRPSLGPLGQLWGPLRPSWGHLGGLSGHLGLSEARKRENAICSNNSVKINELGRLDGDGEEEMDQIKPNIHR